MSSEFEEKHLDDDIVQCRRDILRAQSSPKLKTRLKVTPVESESTDKKDPALRAKDLMPPYNTANNSAKAGLNPEVIEVTPLPSTKLDKHTEVDDQKKILSFDELCGIAMPETDEVSNEVAKEKLAEIPTLDLNTQILADRRKTISVRRKAPGVKITPIEIKTEPQETPIDTAEKPTQNKIVSSEELSETAKDTVTDVTANMIGGISAMSANEILREMQKIDTEIALSSEDEASLDGPDPIDVTDIESKDFEVDVMETTATENSTELITSSIEIDELVTNNISSDLKTEKVDMAIEVEPAVATPNTNTQDQVTPVTSIRTKPEPLCDESQDIIAEIVAKDIARLCKATAQNFIRAASYAPRIA